jgi:signal transduction histidine kinase
MENGPQNLDRWRILIVDDHEPLRAAVQMVLETEGYDVLVAANGVHALDLLEEYHPDLIVADIMMPGMDGYDFCRAVRARPEGVSTPFIFLTARSEREDVLKGKALGVEDYLTKPFHPEELLVVVRARLERAQVVREVVDLEVERLKEQILATLGHELRTPLTHVISYADLILDDAAALPPEMLRDSLVTIREGGERMSRLVGDLLLLIRLDAGRLAEEFHQGSRVRDDLGELVLRTVRRYEQRAVDQGLRLRVRVDRDLPPVRLCEPFFVDALDRLVDNALKFSRGMGQQVVVSAHALPPRPTDVGPPTNVGPTTELRGQGVGVAVTDEGAGIAAEDFPSLFERFRQINRDEMEQQGVGLGLSIARALVRLHGGEITVESTPGEGSRFTIRLPVADAPERSGSSGHAEVRAGAGFGGPDLDLR